MLRAMIILMKMTDGWKTTTMTVCALRKECFFTLCAIGIKNMKMTSAGGGIFGNSSRIPYWMNYRPPTKMRNSLCKKKKSLYSQSATGCL